MDAAAAGYANQLGNDPIYNIPTEIVRTVAAVSIRMVDDEPPRTTSLWAAGPPTADNMLIEVNFYIY